nr:unnamed protein product [Digitaria exilis]
MPVAKISLSFHESGLGDGFTRSLEMVMMVPSLRMAMMSTMNGAKSNLQMSAMRRNPKTIRMFFILWKMDLLVSTALTITLSPGSVSTMSEALRAASVASSTAMPMSAFFNAGASLTPSPVMPQMWPRSWRRLTISYLCSGNTPAKPSAFSMSSSMGMPFTVPFLSPRRVVEGYMLVPMPRRRPVSLPMASWSPVIILTLTPRWRARRMVSALSCLGGSNSGRRPMNCHGSPELSLLFSGTCWYATPSDRRPRSAYPLMRAWTFFSASAPMVQSLMMSSETIPTKSCQSGGLPPPLARTMAMMAAISMTQESGFHMKPRNLSSLLSFFSSSLLGPNALSRPSPSALVRPLRSHFSVLNTSSTGILDCKINN